MTLFRGMSERPGSFVLPVDRAKQGMLVEDFITNLFFVEVLDRGRLGRRMPP